MLAQTLGKGWFKREGKKSPEFQSLITVWLCDRDNGYAGKWFKCWIQDLEIALKMLSQHPTSSEAWGKIQRKVRMHSDSANFKGTMSEIALSRFLIENQFSIELEKKLISSSNKDVDIQISSPNSVPINIEVQWISASKDSKDGAAFAASFGEAYPMQYDREKLRIKQKINNKIPKFTVADVTLVALDFTASSELGGTNRYSVIKETLDEVFLCRDLNRGVAPFCESELHTSIRKYVDGVVWFELIPQKGLGFMPQKRGAYINPNSHHREKIEQSLFAQAWVGESYKYHA